MNARNDYDDQGDWSEAADALIEWYRERPDLALLLIAMDNEIAVMEVAEEMNE